ncbi:MAG: hypothetical protein WCB96_04825 [Candidatus Aminicenantales bacterium]
MKRENLVPMALVLGLGFILLSVPFQAQAAGWGWKKATDPTDVMNFLNGTAPYTQKIIDAEITLTDNGKYLEFIIFYVPGNAMLQTGGWAWKKATDPDDVKNFLSGQGAYQAPVKKARVCAAWRNTYTEYYVFYKQ